MARDAFPFVFAPDPEEPAELRLVRGYEWLPGGAFRARKHADYSELLEALADDPVLRIFAPPGEPFVRSTSGYGSLIHEGALPGLLISSASAAHLAKGKPVDDLDGFLEEIASTLWSFRRLIAGGGAEAGLTVVAFDGLTLGADTRIHTPWGILRPAGAFEAAIRPSGVAPTTILTFARPTRYCVDPPTDESEGVDGLERLSEIQSAIRRAAELLPLAALLGIERDDYLVPRLVWSTNLEPVLVSSGYQFAFVSGPQAQSVLLHRLLPRPRSGGEALTEEEEARLKAWAMLVEQHYDASIEIGVRRTISAVRERTDPQDALIDAVMATENLFGYAAGGTTEVAFRVTTALTLLLEPDPSKRATRRHELGKVYDLRSKVVHGAEITPRMKLPERKEEAIRTAVDALRALFAERPNLIADKDRAMRLLLGTTESLDDAEALIGPARAADA